MIGKVHLKIGGGGLSTAPIYSVIWLIFCRHSLLSPFYEAGDTFASDSETVQRNDRYRPKPSDSCVTIFPRLTSFVCDAGKGDTSLSHRIISVIERRNQRMPTEDKIKYRVGLYIGSTSPLPSF